VHLRLDGSRRDEASPSRAIELSPRQGLSGHRRARRRRRVAGSDRAAGASSRRGHCWLSPRSARPPAKEAGGRSGRAPDIRGSATGRCIEENADCHRREGRPADIPPIAAPSRLRQTRRYPRLVTASLSSCFRNVKRFRPQSHLLDEGRNVSVPRGGSTRPTPSRS